MDFGGQAGVRKLQEVGYSLLGFVISLKRPYYIPCTINLAIRFSNCFHLIIDLSIDVTPIFLPDLEHGMHAVIINLSTFRESGY